MMTVLSVLLALTLGALVIVMVLGIGAMAKGGEVSGKYSNVMMRARVALQALAVAVIVAMFF